MHILKSLAIAFSVYSRIPVPQFAWKEEDLNYMLCFFPWVGAVIGTLVYAWDWLCGSLMIGEMCRTLAGCGIPLLVTGGFHADGFLDTVDGFCSYSPKEKKLEIIKDVHIGAFAVIRFALYGLIYLGAFSEVRDKGILRAVCAGFFLARCLSGIGVLSFPRAKEEGMVHRFAEGAKKRSVKWLLYFQSICCILFMLCQSLFAGIIAAAAFLAFACYYVRTKRELGGITGDTAGYFVLICEGSMMAAAAGINILFF